MKLIPLSKGLFAKVDDEDFEELSKYRWHANVSRGVRPYAERKTARDPISGRQGRVRMHRLVIGAVGGIVDHINGDSLDNRKANLRICSNAENVQNVGPTAANTSGFKGLRFKRGKWDARITANNKQFFLGSFDTKEAAAVAYNEAAKKLHGEFARLNHVE